ncbi:related to Vesicular-fusion protein SEC17 [Hanseniaspora guilliermondii]|uniref:Related to Vesicular-fusion protein SEC17 n=1 Tax=Hanseniaspora guilliermondii TaxID=56406 RepID=A0A1L0B3Z2_9ASCO|nr:related to Vesicular-fusion protein SEC17 [Hanseniaspora guilliermondii]
MSEDPKLLLKQASEKAKPVTGFFWKLISSPEDQYEEAIDLYVQAAKIYRLGNGKVSKDYIKSAECYKDAAMVALERLQNYNDAAMNYIEAYKLCKMGDEYSNACDYLQKAIDIFTKNMGQFRRAANYQFELGEILELQLHQTKQAREAYELAGDWYLQDNAIQLSNKCYLRCADLLSVSYENNDDLFKSIKMYKNLIDTNLKKNLNLWVVKDYYLKIGLLQLLLTDTVASERTLAEAKTNLRDDQDCKEFKLLQALIDCYKEQDIDLMSNTLMKYDKFDKLDSWKTTILLKIKESLIGTEEDDLL